MKNKIRHTLFLSGIRHQTEKTGIFSIGNPSSHCLENSNLNNASLYAAFLPLATTQSASAFGFASRPLFEWATQLRWIAPSPPPSGRQAPHPLSFASLASCWGDKLPSKDYRKPFTPALNILVYIPLECNTYLLSRTIGYGIQATLHRKVVLITL